MNGLGHIIMEPFIHIGNMKKLKFSVYLIILLFCVSCKGPKTTIHQNSKNLKHEISNFIDSLRSNDIPINKYAVFVLVGAIDNYLSKSNCFSVGYILNEFDYKYVEPNYFFKIGDKYVISRLNCSPDSLLYTGIDFKAIDTQSKAEILNTLYPTRKGGFTYEPQSIIFCIKGRNISWEYYDLSDFMPLKFQIFKF